MSQDNQDPTARAGRLEHRGPDFVGIGPGKAGTTWVWEQLRQHPGIFMPDNKELHYFDNELYGAPGSVNLTAERPNEWYRSKFDAARPAQLRGEITPSYFNSQSAPQRLHEFCANIRLFTVLRQPTHRLISMYLFARQRGEIADLAPEDALERYPHLIERCFNAPALERWFGWFPRCQLHVFLYDQLRAHPITFLYELERYLTVAPFVPESARERVNETGQSSYPRLNRGVMRARMAVRRSRSLERLVEPAKKIGLGLGFSWVQRQVRPVESPFRLSAATAARLDDLYRSDTERVEQLTGLDLSRWTAPDRRGGTVR